MSTFTNNNVSSGDVVRASDHNTQGANIAAVVNGNIDADNLASGAVDTAKVVDNAISAAKMLNGQVSARQGGSATDWSATGTTTYDVSATDVKIQCGSLVAAGADSNHTVTFPTAYTNTPLVLCTPKGGSGVYPTWYLVSESNTGFIFREGVNVLDFRWMAIGV